MAGFSMPLFVHLPYSVIVATSLPVVLYTPVDKLTFKIYCLKKVDQSKNGIVWTH